RPRRGIRAGSDPERRPDRARRLRSRLRLGRRGRAMVEGPVVERWPRGADHLRVAVLPARDGYDLPDPTGRLPAAPPGRSDRTVTVEHGAVVRSLPVEAIHLSISCGHSRLETAFADRPMLDRRAQKGVATWLDWMWA